MKSQMTDFARAGRCEGRGASGSAAGAERLSNAESPSRPARASNPAPFPERRSISLRLSIWRLFHIHKFVKVEYDLGEVGQRLFFGIRIFLGAVSGSLFLEEV